MTVNGLLSTIKKGFFRKGFFRQGSALAICLAASAGSHADDYFALYHSLSKAAPDLGKQVLQNALKATQCAVNAGMDEPRRLAVIDFSLPSDQKRLWIFDLENKSLLLKDLVAHGKNSGEREPHNFSNANGSFQSSIGLFQANESYSGKHGYSLRLDGLEPGINDNARDRAIVIHGADYVNPSWIREHGRIGRSLGCPAVRQEVVREVVDNLKGGQLVFTYYPDRHWLQSSNYLNCQQQTAALTFDDDVDSDS